MRRQQHYSVPGHLLLTTGLWLLCEDVTKHKAETVRRTLRGAWETLREELKKNQAPMHFSLDIAGAHGL